MTKPKVRVLSPFISDGRAFYRSPSSNTFFKKCTPVRNLQPKSNRFVLKPVAAATKRTKSQPPIQLSAKAAQVKKALFKSTQRRAAASRIPQQAAPKAPASQVAAAKSTAAKPTTPKPLTPNSVRKELISRLAAQKQAPAPTQGFKKPSRPATANFSSAAIYKGKAFLSATPALQPAQPPAQQQTTVPPAAPWVYPGSNAPKLQLDSWQKYSKTEARKIKTWSEFAELLFQRSSCYRTFEQDRANAEQLWKLSGGYSDLLYLLYLTNST